MNVHFFFTIYWLQYSRHFKLYYMYYWKPEYLKFVIYIVSVNMKNMSISHNYCGLYIFFCLKYANMKYTYICICTYMIQFHDCYVVLQGFILSIYFFFSFILVIICIFHQILIFLIFLYFHICICVCMCVYVYIYIYIYICIDLSHKFLYIS